MRRQFTRQGLQLACYAPGDGAMSFVWHDPATGGCSSRDVTPAIIRQYLKHSDGKHLADYELHRINGELRLVLPFVRVNENTLCMRKEFEYTYKVVDNPPFPHHLSMHDLIVTTISVLDQRMYEVKHTSTLTAMCFFLNHEKELTSTTG